MVVGSAFDGQRRGQGVQQLSSIPTHSEDDFFTGWIPSVAMNGDGVIFRHRRREGRQCHAFINSLKSAKLSSGCHLRCAFACPCHFCHWLSGLWRCQRQQQDEAQSKCRRVFPTVGQSV